MDCRPISDRLALLQAVFTLLYICAVGITSAQAAQAPDPGLAAMHRIERIQRARNQVATAWQYERSGRYFEAIEQYGLALQTAPDYPYKAQIYERMARCSAFLKPPDYWRARGYYLRAAQEYAQQGDTEGAARAREYAQLQEGLAQVAAEKRRLQQKQQAVGAVAQETPQEQARQHYRNALTAWQTADFKTALLEAETAKRLDPKLAETRYLLGLLYEANGHWEQARRELYAFVTLAPRHSLAPQAVALMNRLSQMRLLFHDDFESGGERWLPARTGADAVVQSGARGNHWLAVGGTTDVYTRFPTLMSGSVELLVWVAPGAVKGGTVDLDVILLDETAGARVGALAGAASLRIAFTAGGVYVNGFKCRGPFTRASWHRLGVGIAQQSATVSLDGAVLETVAYPYAVTTLELVGRRLSGSAGPACLDNVRVVAAAAARSASST